MLGCAGCHGPDLSGKSCFVSSGADCLSSANLTNSAAGLANHSVEQIKNAFTKGMDPDQAGKYLFQNMPCYQFANLSDYDANAIVAYLRTVPGVTNTLTANSGAYPEANQPAVLANMTDSDATDIANYLLSLQGVLNTISPTCAQ